MIKHFLTRQFLRFLAVGMLSAFSNWLARVCLSLWLPFSWAVVIAYGIGMSAAFLLNSIFVFPNSEKAWHSQARDFFLVNLAFFPIVWLVSIGVNRWLKAIGLTRYSEELAHAIAIALPLVATFLIYKFFAFKERSYEQQ